jgi:hypothetical protein
MPIASSLYTLHEGRQVREEEIGGGKLLRALCDLGVKAIGFWNHHSLALAATEKTRIPGKRV